MAAPKGNKFWLNRSKHGRDKLFSTPDLLWEAATEYFTWCDNNPWLKKEAIKSGDMCGELVSIPTQRPFTLSGFLLYIGASEGYLRQFKTTASEDFLTVIENIEQAMYTQKFEGAAVGAFNANIIARDLGLAEKSEGKTTQVNYNVETTPEEVRNISKQLDGEF